MRCWRSLGRRPSRSRPAAAPKRPAPRPERGADASASAGTMARTSAARRWASQCGHDLVCRPGAGERMPRRPEPSRRFAPTGSRSRAAPDFGLVGDARVEPAGIEPATSSVQSRSALPAELWPLGRNGRWRRPPASLNWTDVEFWALEFQGASERRPKSWVTTARRVPSSQVALGAAGLHQARGPPGRAVPRRNSSAVARPASVEVEVARRLLLEPEPVVLRRLLEEVRRVLEHVGVLVVLAGLDPRRRVVASSGSSSSASKPRGGVSPAADRRRLRRRAGSGSATGVARLGWLAASGSSASGPGSVERPAPRPRGARASASSGGVRLGRVSASGGCCSAPSRRRLAGATSRRAGPSASSSWRRSSSSAAPWRRLSSRCSRIASSRTPIGAKAYRGCGGRPTRPPTSAGRAHGSARSTRLRPARFAR